MKLNYKQFINKVNDEYFNKDRRFENINPKRLVVHSYGKHWLILGLMGKRAEAILELHDKGTFKIKHLSNIPIKVQKEIINFATEDPKYWFNNLESMSLKMTSKD